MLFNSPEFLFVFLPLTLLAFALARYHSGAMLKASLLAASLLFYSYWNIAFLPLLLGSVLANYLIGVRLSRFRSRALLLLGLLMNLGLLAYFKYAGFFLESVNSLSGTGLTIPQIVLPIGISFITFEQIAFIVDAYRGKVKNRRFIDYALFVTFFPQLIAGPIFHHRDMCPQFTRFTKGYSARAHQVAHGLFLLSLGLFKKVIIADYLAGWANPVFSAPEAASFYDAWVAALSYTFQLYFDFSAYSEMAMGLALFFGICIPINFNSPYKSRSISEFWRRWHITLGDFLREYLYVPLGGNRHGVTRTMIALATVMLLGGLWHGAGWTFVCWGALHGAYLIINLAWRQTGFRLPHPIGVLITFLAVVFAWVLFRADTIDGAVSIWSSMIGLNGLVIPSSLHAVFGDQRGFEYVNSIFYTGVEPFLLTLVLAAVWALPNVHELRERFLPKFRWWVATVVPGAAAIAMLGAPTSFIYWQF